MSLVMVFDVESTSLHGDGYAVGYVVGDMDGNVMEVGRIAAPMPDHACQWVRDNVPPVNVAPFDGASDDAEFDGFLAAARSAGYEVYA